MPNIDLSFLAPYMPTLYFALPGVVACIAGVLRQDRLPKWANECITYALVLVAAVIGALYNHILGVNPLLDFIAIAGYMMAVLQTPYMQQLQVFLQSNVLAFIGQVAHMPAPQPQAQAVPVSPAAAPVQPQPKSLTRLPR